MSIIVQLQGGLGNQMFQYAFAKGMSRRHHTDFLLDTFGYQRSPRPYELEHFAIQPSYAQKADLPRWQGDKYANRTKMRILNRIAKPLLQKLDRHTYLEAEGVGFDPRLLEPKQGYFLGRFQNEKYFMEPTLQSELRKDFSFLSLPSQQNAQVIEEMEQTLSVSVHIRRGDYLNPEYQGFFWTCGLPYYTEAIDYVKSKLPQPRFFFFSDEIARVKKHLPQEHAVYVDRNTGSESYRDLALMSKCKHHIIANSSFSRWGAWLNPNAQKIVVAPKHRFTGHPGWDTIVPEERIKL